MTAYVLSNLLNELKKSDKMRGLPSILSLILNSFNKFNNTGARMLYYIYHTTIKLTKKYIFGLKTSTFCHLLRNIITDANTLPYYICKPLVVYQFYYMTLYHSQTRRHVINTTLYQHVRINSINF